MYSKRDDEADFVIKNKWHFDKNMMRKQNKGCSKVGMGVLFKLF